MTINDQVFAKATHLLEPILNDFAKTLATMIAPLLPQARGHRQSATTSQEEQRLRTLRETMAHNQQETLRALNETAWSDAAIAKIPDLDLVKFAYQCSGVLREEFHTVECFEAYWRNLSRRNIRRSAHDERGKR